MVLMVIILIETIDLV